MGDHDRRRLTTAAHRAPTPRAPSPHRPIAPIAPSPLRPFVPPSHPAPFAAPFNKTIPTRNAATTKQTHTFAPPFAPIPSAHAASSIHIAAPSNPPPAIGFALAGPLPTREGPEKD